MYTRGEKFIAIFVIIAVVGVTVVLSVPSYLEQRENAAQLRKEAAEYEQMMRELEVRRSSLECDIEALEDELSGAEYGLGTAVILATEPDARLKDTVVKDLEALGFKGAIGVSEDHFPGKKGMLTVKEVKELAADGWEIVAVASKKDVLWKLVKKMETAGLPKPKAFYCYDGSYPDSAKSLILKYGGNVVQRTDIEYTDAAHGKLWRIKAMGSAESGAKKALESSVDSSSCMVLTVGFTEARDMYTESNFSAMMNALTEYTEAGYLKVTNFTKARKQSEMKEELLAEKRADIEEQKAELSAELAEINEKIASGR